MRRLRPVEIAAPFHDQRVRRLHIFVPGDGAEEIARIGEAVRTNGSAVGQCEAAAIVLAHISARRAIARLDAENDAARNDADLARLDLDHAEFGAESQPVLLRDDQQLAVRVAEMLADHRGGDEHHMRRHARHGLAIARGRHGAQTGDESQLFARDWRRVPAQLADRRFALALRRGADQAGIDALEPAGMPHAGPNAIEPGAFVRGLWRGERRAGELFGVKAVIHLLRRVAADG